MVTRTLAMAILTGCALVESTPDPAALSAEAWVVRASLDLRGVRPTLDEIRRVHADPAEADALVDAFLADPRFGGRLADHYNELYLTRTERWPVPPAQYGLDVAYPAYVAALGDEVPRIVQRVADEDLPWTELVLGDWTMADDVLLSIWPLAAEGAPDADGWRVARYTDGRPAAGVLSTNSLWWRYGSTDSNANRGRAAQVSRLFLCVDYSAVTVPFDPSLDLLDAEAVEDAIRTNPSCTACHDRLDPLAGYLYGFWYVNPNLAVEASVYHPDRELLYRTRSRLDPALDGAAGFSLRDLGRQVASHERFPDCAVEQAWTMLLRRPPADADEAERVAVRNQFVQEGLRIRELYARLVRSPLYRTAADDGAGLRLATPELLASAVEDLTGFRWTTEQGWDLMTADEVGFRGLAGGADGTYALKNAELPNATSALVLERLAEAAAFHVVLHDVDAPPAQRRLFHHVDLATDTAATAEAAFRDELVDLHARIFGTQVAPDGPEVTAHLELYGLLLEVDPDPARAWAGVLSAMLRDPDFLLY